MIRINLLAVDRERAKRRVISFQIEKIKVALSLILLAGALTVGWWYWMLTSRAVELEARVQDAQRESLRRGGVIRQVQQFEQRKAQLQQRVALVEQLRQGQSAPVHMLDELSRGVPEMLWLTDLKQDGNALTIGGRCMTLTALSDFVANLEASGYYRKPVEIVDSQVDTGSREAQTEVFKFTVKAQFAMPAPGAPAPPSAARTGG